MGRPKSIDSIEEFSPEHKELLEKNWSMVFRLANLAKKSFSKRINLDDLVGLATDGLLKACVTYDAKRGPPFTSWAYMIITYEIKNRWKDLIDWRTIHQRKAGAPTTQSLDNIEDGSSAYKRKAYIAYSREEDPADIIGRADEYEYFISLLPEEEKDIINAWCVDGLTHLEIGENLGLTRARIGQIINNVLFALRKVVRNGKETPNISGRFVGNRTRNANNNRCYASCNGG